MILIEFLSSISAKATGMKKKPPFFEIEQALSDEEREYLALFAQFPFLKTGKKAAELLVLLNEVAQSKENVKDRILWLQRKLYPDDESGRNFRRAARQAEEIFMKFLPYQQLEKNESTRLLLSLDALLNKPLEKQFKSKLRELEAVLGNQKGRNAEYFLYCYLKEDVHRKLLAKRRKIEEYQFGTALEQLNRYYLLEKLKYAIFYLQLSKISQEKLPTHLAKEIDFLSAHHIALINKTPVLSIYLKMYRLFLEEEKGEAAESVLNLLEQHSKNIPEEELRDLYALVAGLLIDKINNACLPLEELKEAYKEYFRLNQLLDKQGLLKEGEYIPQERFKNVVASALNTGEPQDITWAEEFLNKKHKLVHPENEDAIKDFCQGAISFYKREYEDCLAALRNVPNANRFYYCDIKSLELRTHYEQSKVFFDYDYQVNNIMRVIKNDKKMSEHHREAYLNFFDFSRQLFRLRESGKPDKTELTRLKTEIEGSRVAQKKWLLEKIQEMKNK